MYDSPEERLAALRFLERVQQHNLARTRRWIQAAEQRATEEQHHRAPPAEWGIQHGAGSARRMLHTADCWARGKKTQAVNREQAIEALAGGVAPCDVCEPDKALDVLE